MVFPLLNKNKHITTPLLLSGLLLILNGCSSSSNPSPTIETLSNDATIITLGEKIFFDENLSSNSNQSCASCHDPAAGFADPGVTTTAPVSEGSVAASFGNRNAPTSAYVSFSPDFGLTTTPDTSEDGSKYQGGQFLDGRSIDLVDQAKAPFLNEVEMNNADEAEVVNKVMNSTYADDFRSVFGSTAFDDTMIAYNNIAEALAAFEMSQAMNPFTSKFDAFQLDSVNNPLTASELRGFELFKDKDTAKCANCHVIGTPDTGPALFTNFKYFNIGTPSNPDNPDSTPDLGLGGVINETNEDGKFKVPTLRNIALTAPYMHNGVYETLQQVVTHYDIQVANEFIFPEVDRNIASELNKGTFEGLNLSEQNYIDLIAFMETLTDGYF